VHLKNIKGGAFNDELEMDLDVGESCASLSPMGDQHFGFRKAQTSSSFTVGEGGFKTAAAVNDHNKKEAHTTSSDHSEDNGADGSQPGSSLKTVPLLNKFKTMPDKSQKVEEDSGLPISNLT